MLRIVPGRAWKLVPQAKCPKACKPAHEYLDHYVEKFLGDARASQTSKDPNIDPVKSSMLRGVAAQRTTEAMFGHGSFNAWELRRKLHQPF
jgi:hypothetical protein